MKLATALALWSALVSPTADAVGYALHGTYFHYGPRKPGRTPFSRDTRGGRVVRIPCEKGPLGPDRGQSSTFRSDSTRGAMSLLLLRPSWGEEGRSVPLGHYGPKPFSFSDPELS